MASIIPGFEYDIFISYRQKDNKGERWVSEFVDSLKAELESTFKEEISVYFDINPHDGLLENHDVEASLREKLKCAVFIPIISNTYCDPNSFAWEHEFKAFVELASIASFGLKIKLPGGNVANRVLPVRIHDLDASDIKLCESVLGGALRGVEFIYKSPGVNRPLRAKEENPHNNLNHAIYRDQINKVAHAIKEIINGLKTEPILPVEAKIQRRLESVKAINEQKKERLRLSARLPFIKLFFWIGTLVILAASVMAYPKIFKRGRDNAVDLSGEEVLNKAIEYYDVFHSWNNYYGKVKAINIRDNGTMYEEVVEINTRDGFYQRTSISGNDKVVVGIINGQCFSEINGESNPSRDIIKEWWSGGCDDLRRLKQHQYFELGMLMELQTSGLTLEKTVKTADFLGSECYALTFTCDTNKVKNNYFREGYWVVYLDPQNYSVKGYKLGSGYYVVCSGILDVNGIKVPICKSYFRTKDNSYISVEVFAKAE
jgi:hypothetical protein